MKVFAITDGETRPRMKPFVWVAAVVFAALLSACASGNDEPSGLETATATPSTAPSTTPSTAPSTAPSTEPSSADSTATTVAPTAPVPIEPVLVLRHDGLGTVLFGQPVDTVMEVLETLLGQPDLEEVQVSPDVDRSVQWDDPFLYLQFTAPDHFQIVNRPDAVSDVPLFHYYLTTSDRFATAAGVTTASTVTELRDAYPGVRFHQDCGGPGWEFVVDPPGDWPELPIFGLLDGEVDSAETGIVYIGAGWDRTPC